MAKAAQKTTALAPVKTSSGSVVIPDWMQEYAQEDAGKGYSHAAEDSIIPFISVLQPLSPQLKPKNEKYIKGAEVGDFYVKGALDPIVKGEDGIEFIQAGFDKWWVEWVPRGKGGGYVGRHKAKPSDTVEKPNPENPEKMKLYRKNGNEIIETRYHYGLYKGLPYVIGFTSTGHTVSREWTNMIKMVGEGRPVFAHKYHLTTKMRTKNDQEWFVVVPQPVKKGDTAVLTTKEEYMAARSLEKAVTSGEKVIEAEDSGEYEDMAGGVKEPF